jgi:hypothetical protein
VEAGEVYEHGAEERHGDPHRADHEILPRRFERAARLAVPDEESSDDRRGFDRHPHDSEVPRQHGQEHGGYEPLDKHAVERGVAPAAAACGDLDVEVTHTLPRSEHADHPDDDHHEGA